MHNRVRRSSCLLRRVLPVAAWVLIGIPGSHGDAASPAPKESVLYSFCGKGGLDCTDGAQPVAGLARDAAGNFYGTTKEGGAYGGGAVFELTRNTGRAGWAQKVLYSFCAQGGIDCSDGAFPTAGLIIDPAGNLYGTTSQGGGYASPGNQLMGGTVFALIRDPAGTKYTRKTLYSFCRHVRRAGTCVDGAVPTAGLIRDSKGRLYGTTAFGGQNGGGTVFELTPNAVATPWTQTVLYSFGAQANDGDVPDAGLIADQAGNLYGTTEGGGYGNGVGTVFELTPNAGGADWTENVLYRFCPLGGNCTDGALPEAGLIMDAAGNLYGTTTGGGAHGQWEFSDAGTVFELTPNTAKTEWAQRVLYSFGAHANFADGDVPAAGLVMDKAGNLYGTTQVGGANRDGTVFELAPNAAGTAWTRRVLYSFCARGGAACTDGAAPAAGLIIDPAGNLYGTTQNGGVHADGTVSSGGTVFGVKP